MLSCIQLSVTLWTVAHQAPLSMGILQAKILEWAAISFSRAQFKSYNVSLFLFLLHVLSTWLTLG